jgi:phospholipase C
MRRPLLTTFLLTLSVALAQTEQEGSAQAVPSTPIEHLVIIFQENRSFDHYFGTYPVAANPQGQPVFVASPDTPSVNGLTETLLNHNPNLVNPFRLDRTQALTCDHSHEYVPEQKAYNRGLLNQFIQQIEVFPASTGEYCPKNRSAEDTIVMGYFDGNTVTALWNYAQSFALSDNFFGTTFGPSTVGAINLAAADNSGVLCGPMADQNGEQVIIGEVPSCGGKGAPPASSRDTPAPRGQTTATNIGDPDPFWDVCSEADASTLMAMGGRNIGDLLTEAAVSWGFFQGGFKLSANGTCDSAHVRQAYDLAVGINPATDLDKVKDYVPHHNPFQYYASTANPQHLPPTSVKMVGRTDRANHLYDFSWFWRAAEAGNMPAVSFLRAPAYQDGHANYSDPLDEQQFLVKTLNRLQRLPEWEKTAVIIAYDDGGGWYDHVMPPIINHSDTPLDLACGESDGGPPGRCGYGPRLPLLVISPYAKQNYVSNVLIDQTSITRFIEDNWLSGERISEKSFDNLAGSLLDMFDFDQPPASRLFLNPIAGQPDPDR